MNKYFLPEGSTSKNVKRVNILHKNEYPHSGTLMICIYKSGVRSSTYVTMRLRVKLTHAIHWDLVLIQSTPFPECSTLQENSKNGVRLFISESIKKPWKWNEGIASWIRKLTNIQGSNPNLLWAFLLHTEQEEMIQQSHNGKKGFSILSS
jgi:hypothetical protein